MPHERLTSPSAFQVGRARISRRCSNSLPVPDSLIRPLAMMKPRCASFCSRSAPSGSAVEGADGIENLAGDQGAARATARAHQAGEGARPIASICCSPPIECRPAGSCAPSAEEGTGRRCARTRPWRIQVGMCPSSCSASARRAQGSRQVAGSRQVGGSTGIETVCSSCRFRHARCSATTACACAAACPQRLGGGCASLPLSIGPDRCRAAGARTSTGD